MTETETVLNRSDVEDKYKWNAESLFATPEDWQKALEAFPALIEKVAAFKGRLAEGPSVLADCQDAMEKGMLAIGPIFVYASMAYNCETTNQAAAGMMGQVQATFGKAMAAIAFIDPEILAIGKEKLEKWMAEEPRLAVYEHYIDDLFRRQEHVRSAEVEEVLGLSSDPLSTAYQTYNMLNSADLTFEPATTSDGKEMPLTQGTLDKYYSMGDRELRRTAYENYTDRYLEFKNTFASNLAAGIKGDVFYARARRYETALDASLHADNIPTSVFHNFLEVFKKNLPVWHRYWEVRAKALKIEKAAPYDVWAPSTEVNPEMSYEECIGMICDGLAPLGEEYVETVRQGCLQDRWVDVYPTAGKQQGAFSSGWKGTFPFIKMNYVGDVKSLSTLAHELGHSMHSWNTWHNQPTVYSNYTIFLAEVASNFNQALVRDYLLKTHEDDPYFQIAVLEEAMSNFHRYFFIMPTLARFELETHTWAEQGRPLTAEAMVNLTADLFGEGYGSTMAYDHDRVGITWATFQHMYMNYYVFQYGTGISGAHALATRVLAGDSAAVDAYLTFLKTGSSRYSLDTLKSAGVDLNTPEPVEAAFEVLAGYVDRLDKLADEIG